MRGRKQTFDDKKRTLRVKRSFLYEDYFAAPIFSASSTTISRPVCTS